MPSILKTKALASGARVIRYLNKYGFSNIKLTIYIMDIESSLDQVVALEQEFIDTLKPNLNVDLVAASSGYPEPMSQEIRNKLRKERGIPIFMYHSTLAHETRTFLYESKQQMYSLINIHHKSLNDCLDLGSIYLDYFFLCLDPLESEGTNLHTKDEIKTLV